MIQQELPTRQRLIRLIRESGGSTLADLRRRTGLSRSTLRQHLGRMARRGETAERVAAQHPETRAPPDMSARLDAVRRLFFSDAEATQVERTDGGYQFSLYTCPLAPVAMEFRDLCCVTRGVIRGLVGEEVEQSEWIIRGDPRCTFEGRGGGDGSGGGHGKDRGG